MPPQIKKKNTRSTIKQSNLIKAFQFDNLKIIIEMVLFT